MCFTKVSKFHDKSFVSVEREFVDPDEFSFIVDPTFPELTTQRQFKAIQKYYDPLTREASKILGGGLNVKIGRILVTSPALVSTPLHGLTAGHERLARTTPGNDKMRLEYQVSMKILELNPRHPIVHELLENLTRGDDIKDTIELLHETSLIASGYNSRKPHLLMELIYKSLGKNHENLIEDLEIPENIYDSIDIPPTKDEQESDDGEDDDDHLHDEL